MPCLLVLLSLPDALASPADFFGFGGDLMGRGGAGIALPGTAGAALINPAGLSGRDASQLSLGYTLVRYNFAELPPIAWDTNRDGLVDSSDDPLDLNDRYDPADGFMIALSRPVNERFGFGLAMFGPQGRLLRLRTMEPSLPTYFLYDNRAHKYELALALGGAPLRGLHVGAGIRLISRSVLNVTMTIDATVSGEPDQDTSADDLVQATMDIHDLSFDLVPRAVPVLGARWDVGEHIPALEGLAIAATFRGTGAIPVEFNLDAQVNGHAEDIGDLDPVTAALAAQASVLIFDHYIPRQVQYGVAYTWRERLSAAVDVQQTAWEAMGLSVSKLQSLALQATMAELGDLPVQDGNDTSGITFRNTVGVRAGVEGALPPLPLPDRWGPGELRLRGGFGYEPSPLVSQTADTALLDSDRLIFAGGASLAHERPGEAEGPMRWDLFFQTHRLASGTLQRPEQDVPRAGYPQDNAPVPIGGGFFATGLQWSLDY